MQNQGDTFGATVVEQPDEKLAIPSVSAVPVVPSECDNDFFVNSQSVQLFVGCW